MRSCAARLRAAPCKTLPTLSISRRLCPSPRPLLVLQRSNHDSSFLSSCSSPFLQTIRPPCSMSFATSTTRTTSSEAPVKSDPPRKCTGCGVKLQCTKETQRGFVPPPKFEATAGNILCHRCWGMRHHNKLTKPEVHDIGVLERALGGKKGTLIKLIDLLDVHGSYIPNFSQLAAGLPVVVIGNKFDLLPHGAKAERVREWLKTETQKLGLSQAQALDYILLSAKTGEGFTSLKSCLREIATKEATGRDLYVVGSTNVGKSSFINRLMDRFERRVTDLTVSHYPGTTLDVVSFPLASGQTVHDTPGITNTSHIVPVLTPEELEVVQPRKCLRPITYRVMPGKTIFLGGLARIDVISTSSPFCYITFFASSDLLMHIHATRIERAADVYRRHLTSLLQPPFPPKNAKSHRDFPPLEPHKFKVRGTSWTKAECDITLAGVGWIGITLDGEVSLEIHMPYPIKPKVTPPLMPFELANREKRIRKHGKIEPSAPPPRNDIEEPKDIEKNQMDEQIKQKRAAMPVSLKRWTPNR